MFTLEDLRSYINAKKPSKLSNLGDEPYSKDNLLDGIINNTTFKTYAQLNIEYGGSLGPSNGVPLNSSVFTYNPDGFDIPTACNWLHTNSTPNTQHICATYVRAAIDVGFHTDPGRPFRTNYGKPSYTGTHGEFIDRSNQKRNGRPGWAWEYINYLPSIGFKCIGTASADSSYSPVPGDIAVYQKNGNPNVPGHICMWTGAEWASDFRQRNMIVYKGTPAAYLYRFAG